MTESRRFCSRLQTYLLIRSARATGWRCGGYFLVGSFIIGTFQCDLQSVFELKYITYVFFLICLVDRVRGFGILLDGPQSSRYIYIYIFTCLYFTDIHTYIHIYTHILIYLWPMSNIYSDFLIWDMLWQWSVFYALVNVHVLNNAVVPWNMLRWYEKLQFNVMTVGSNMGISSLCCKCLCQHHSIICTPDK